MSRWLGVLVLVVAACGDSDGPSVTSDGGAAGDGGHGGDGGGSGVDPPACVGASELLGDGTRTTCDFEVGVTFDPGAINIVLLTGATREVVCHTLRETGCTGDGWYWDRTTKLLTLCGNTCDLMMSGGTGTQVYLETGCSTESCGGGSCTQSTGYCTHSTASTCCSGRCDGDSCGSGLWGPCPGMFGCFEGTCQSGFCRCPAGDLQCGARCFDPMTSNEHCGACDNACSGGKTCDGGACVCPTGTTDCNGTCVSLSSDDANCGMCGVACRSDQSCSGGTCACAATELDCNGACVSRTSPLHCGACNNACDAATETCTPFGGGAACACNAGLFDCGSNGTCEDRMTDENNCGTCGRVCPGNKTCIAGDC